MIELDVVAHLKADATLDALLNSSATDSKIYPIQAGQNTNIPFIVYEVSSRATGFEIIEEDTIQFNVFSDNYITCGNIIDQLKKLLYISDELRVGGSQSIASDIYYIYSGVVNGSSEFRDPDTNFFCKIISFSFQYKRKI